MKHSAVQVLKDYWFLGGLGATLALSHIFPEGGVFLDAHGGSKAAIIALFVMSGMAVSLRKLNADLADWRFHLIVWGYCFALIPILTWATSTWLPDGPLKHGVYFVAVIPTTISSSIAFTTAARGNTASAIVSAVGGNLIGVVLSPLALSLMVGGDRLYAMRHAARTIADMCLLVLLPFAIGQAIGALTPVFREKRREVQAVAAQVCVLLLMYFAFSKSLNALVAQMAAMWQCFAYLAVAQVLYMIGAIAVAYLFRVRQDQRPVVLYCGTQKTMAFGVPLAHSFFRTEDSAVGLVIIPLTFYYLLQMLTGSFALHRLFQRNEAPPNLPEQDARAGV